MVPVLAVSRIGGQYFAFVAEEDKGKMVAHQRPLQIGDIVGNDYVVLNGLKAGDKVIVSGTQFWWMERRCIRKPSLIRSSQRIRNLVFPLKQCLLISS